MSKRIGRPTKPPTGKRVQLGLIVRADIKRAIIKAAEQSGRTQSQEAELLIERAWAYDGLIEKLGAVIELNGQMIEKLSALLDAYDKGRRPHER